MCSARGVSWDFSHVSEREDCILFSGFASRTDRKRWGARSTRESIVIAVRGTSGSFSAIRCGNIYTALSAHATRCTRVRAAVTRVRVCIYNTRGARRRQPTDRPAGAARGMQLLFNVYACLLAKQVDPAGSLICERICERTVAYLRARPRHELTDLWK